MKYFVLIFFAGLAVGAASVSKETNAASPSEDVFALKSEIASKRAKRVEAMSAFVRAQELREKNQLEEALKYYDKALEADPDYETIKIAKAEVLYALDRPDDALKLLKKLPKDSPEVCSLIAWGLLKKDIKSAQARELLDKTVKLGLASDSQAPTFYLKIAFRLTVLYLKCGDNNPNEVAKKVMPFFEKAASLDPRNPQYQLLAAEMALHAEKYEKAIYHYEKVSSMTNRLPELQHRIALLLALTDKEEKAIPILEELLEQKPDEKTLYPLLGKLYERTNKLDKAENNYLLAIKLGQPSIGDYLQLAIVQIKNDKPEEGSATLLEAQKLFPTQPHIPLLRGIALRNAKKYKDAISAFGLAETLGENKEDFLDSNFYFEYAVTYERSGNLAEAEKYFKKCLKLNPNNHLALNYIGYTWAERGEKLDQAEAYLKKAIQLDPKNAAYHDSIGWVYYQKGNYKEAEKNALLAAKDKRGVDDPEINEHLGDIYLKLENTAKAIHYWQHALDKIKDDDERRQRLIEKIKEHSNVKTSDSKPAQPETPVGSPAPEDAQDNQDGAESSR